MSKRLAAICIVSAGALWGMIAIFVRALSAIGLEEMELVAIRSFGSLLFMSVIILIYNRKLFIIRIKDCWCFIGTGIFSLIFFNWCYFKTINYISLSVAAILLYTAPAIVVVLSSILFKERLTVKKVTLMCISFIGCVFVVGVFSTKPIMNLTGVLIGLGAGFGYALYSIFGRYALNRGYSSLTIIFYTFLFSTVGTLPFISSHRVREVVMGGEILHNIILIMGLALISTVFPYILYTVGLTKVGNGKASIMASIEPVVATIVGIAVFQESLSLTGIVGIILVIGAVISLNLEEK